MPTRNTPTSGSLQSDIGRKPYEDNPYSTELTNAKMRLERSGDGFYFGNKAYDNRGNLTGKFRSDGAIDITVTFPRQSPQQFEATDKAVKAMAGSFLPLAKITGDIDPKDEQRLSVKLANDSQRVLRSLGYGLDTIKWNDSQSASDFIARVNGDGLTYAKEALKNFLYAQAVGHAAYGREIYNEQAKTSTLVSGAGSVSDPEGNVELYDIQISNPRARAEYDSTIRQQKRFNNYKSMVQD